MDKAVLKVFADIEYKVAGSLFHNFVVSKINDLLNGVIEVNGKDCELAFRMFLSVSHCLVSGIIAVM